MFRIYILLHYHIKLIKTKVFVNTVQNLKHSIKEAGFSTGIYVFQKLISEHLSLLGKVGNHIFIFHFNLKIVNFI